MGALGVETGAAVGMAVDGRGEKGFCDGLRVVEEDDCFVVGAAEAKGEEFGALEGFGFQGEKAEGLLVPPPACGANEFDLKDG